MRSFRGLIRAANESLDRAEVLIERMKTVKEGSTRWLALRARRDWEFNVVELLLAEATTGLVRLKSIRHRRAKPRRRLVMAGPRNAPSNHGPNKQRRKPVPARKAT